MTTISVGWHRPAGLLALLLSLLMPATVCASSAMGDRAPEAQVKAAFLLNFVRFAEWPATPEDSSLVVCVVGDERLAAALVDSLRRPAPDVERVQVWRPTGDGAAKGCHVVFIAASELRHATAILDTIRGRAILTVSDATRFAKSGGMIELFLEGGRMRFAVNVDAVQQAHMRLSSRLLGLAKIVRDDHGQ